MEKGSIDLEYLDNGEFAVVFFHTQHGEEAVFDDEDDALCFKYIMQRVLSKGDAKHTSNVFKQQYQIFSNI